MRRCAAGIAAALVLALGVALVVRRGPVNRGEERASAPVTEAEEPMSGASPTSSTVAAATSAPAAGNPLVRAECAGCVSESATGLAFKWMLRHQNEDGSWGDGDEIFEGHLHTRTTATALTLLALFSAGYTHLTREKVDDRSFGDAIKAALHFLDAHPPTDAFEAAVSALAMTEAYGLTESAAIRATSEDLRARFDAFQRCDATRGDGVAEAWAGEASASARLAELAYDEVASERAVARLRDSLEAAPTAEAAAAYILMAKDKSDPALATLALALQNSPPDAEKPDFTHWYFGTMVLKQLEGTEGPAGESWKTWSTALRDALLRNQDRDGSWPGESGATGAAVRNALGTLSLEIYYRYASVLGGK